MDLKLEKLEPFCKTKIQKDTFKRLKKIQNFNLNRDGWVLLYLLERIFISEKYEAIQLYYIDLVQNPFLENLPSWANTEFMLCLCYENPLATTEQKQAIEERLREISSFQASIPEAQELYDNYLPNILSLSEISLRQTHLEKAKNDKDEFQEHIMRMSLVEQAVRVKIANAITQSNIELTVGMDKIITEQLTELRSKRMLKYI